MFPHTLIALPIAILIGIIWLFISVNILREYERAVVFRLGHVLERERHPASLSSSGRSRRWSGSRFAS